MAVVKVAIRRMQTSREGPTKFEHFTVLINDEGKEFDMYMRYDPKEALFQSMELAQFMDVPCDPLVIDGVTVELDSVLKMMLDRKED